MIRGTLGRMVMWLLFVLTLAAFADGLPRMAAGDRTGYGLRPGARSPVSFSQASSPFSCGGRAKPSIWELVFAHKTAVVLDGVRHRGGVNDKLLALIKGAAESRRRASS